MGSVGSLSANIFSSEKNAVRWQSFCSRFSLFNKWQGVDSPSAKQFFALSKIGKALAVLLHHCFHLLKRGQGVGSPPATILFTLVKKWGALAILL